MKNAVLLNAYGMKNVGDAAITMVALELLGNHLIKDGLISCMFIDKGEKLSFYQTNAKLKNVWSPYGAAIISEKGRPVTAFVKIWRFLIILLRSIGYEISDRFYSRQQPAPYGYISAIRNAEYVVGIGGGYLRTKSKYADFFGLILTLLPIYIAKLSNKTIIHLPISFGNFASKSHMMLTYWALKGSTVLCRDEISYLELKRLDVDCSISLKKLPDLALYLSYDKPLDLPTKMQSTHIVMTARKWLDSKKQAKYEEELISTILALYDTYGLKTVFVSTAHNNVEDNDNDVANAIQRIIQNDEVFMISKASTPREVQDVISGARFAICTRMHSAILAVTTRTPFITIGYEYKSRGLMMMLDLEKWHTEIDSVSSNEMMKLVNDLLIAKSYKLILKKMELFYKKHPVSTIVNALDNL